ncbi:MAG: Uma2 family endonuclease [Lachnospiraceae bacterium]|nr:Uma2 family endonuclease [Lachnospiraceae bacterium]
MTIEEMRKRKRQLEYTNAQLSNMTGIPLGTLNKILCGATKNPRPENLKALEQVLQDTNYLYGYRSAAPFMVAEASQGYSAEAKKDPAEKGPGDFTIDDYYALPEDQRVELIDGVFYDMAAPTVEHQLLTGSIHAQFLAFIRRKKGKCIPLVSPVDVKLDADNKTMVQPDVVVVCDKERITDRVVLGGPDFVLEVVSPSSVLKDYVKKAAKYEAAGVREYWIVDPISRRVITYDFTEGSLPGVHPLSGKVGVALFHDELQIDFDEYRELLQ